MGKESLRNFELLYSTGSSDISDFILLQTINEVPDQWTKYTFDLPNGTRHFAVRCVSEDKMLFMLDDITYKPELLEVLGYNIYSDGKLIGQTDAEIPIFIDDSRNTERTYHISALYAEGESLPIKAVKQYTSIEDFDTEQAKVSTCNGHILISDAADKTVRVYNINGMVIYDSHAGVSHDITVERGFYIVQIGSNSTRVAVK